MGIQFATCDPRRALEFLNRVYPSYIDLRPEDVPLLLGLITNDVLRVTDPDFHSCELVAGNNYGEGDQAEVDAAIAEFQGALTLKEAVE